MGGRRRRDLDVTGWVWKVMSVKARNRRPGENTMNKMAGWMVAFVVWAAVASGADTGWKQAGVRAWYFGGVDGEGANATDGEEAYLI